MTGSEPFSIHALELGPMENFVYLVHDHASGRAAVVDPAWDVPEVLALAESRGVRITDILLTHSHHDHINGINDVLDRYDAQLHLMKDEAQFWGQALDLPTLHHGGDVIALGDTEIKTLLTPGHTPGSVVYLVDSDRQRILFGQDVHGPLHDDFASDAVAYRRSLSQMADLGADILCEGHYGVVRGAEKVRDFIFSFL